MSSVPLSQPKDPLRILPIGETGSGKTTLINCFANYSRYPTLDEAIKNGPIVLADVGFTYTSADVKGQLVSIVGSSAGKEQVSASGTTCTGGPATYSFCSADSEDLIFYDNPGFGSQSAEQVDGVKKPVHALCIVLKPDETRLHPKLRTFLGKEGKAFSKNMIYCFTNTRSHNFQPAATLTTLRDFLLDMEDKVGIEFPTKRENVFCFENDCFRYLCYLTTTPNGERSRHHKVFLREWERNVKEFKRLVSYVKSLTLILSDQPEEQDIPTVSDSESTGSGSPENDSEETEASDDLNFHPYFLEGEEQEEETVSEEEKEEEITDTERLSDQVEQLSIPEEEKFATPPFPGSPFPFLQNATPEEIQKIHKTILSDLTPAWKNLSIERTLNRRNWELFGDYGQSLGEQILAQPWSYFGTLSFPRGSYPEAMNREIYERMKEELTTFNQGKPAVGSMSKSQAPLKPEPVKQGNQKQPTVAKMSPQYYFREEFRAKKPEQPKSAVSNVRLLGWNNSGKANFNSGFPNSDQKRILLSRALKLVEKVDNSWEKINSRRRELNRKISEIGIPRRSNKQIDYLEEKRNLANKFDVLDTLILKKHCSTLSIILANLMDSEEILNICLDEKGMFAGRVASRAKGVSKDLMEFQEIQLSLAEIEGHLESVETDYENWLLQRGRQFRP